MTVLVTGASGLIGSHTLEALLERGESVRTFQRGAPRQRGVDHIPGDVRTDTAALCAAARGCQAIVHLAGRGDVGESRRDPVGYAVLNATGVLHALEAARAAGASFVLASSQRVYPLAPEPRREDAAPAPDSPYGYAKWVGELWCRMASEQYAVPTTALRFFSVYGPGQQANGGSGVVSIFANAALAGRPLVVQSAGRRDFTDARDVARGILLALDQPSDGRHRTYNIATGLGTTFEQLACHIVELAGSASRIEVSALDAPGNDLVADVCRAREELGYAAAIDLRAGLSRYIEWLRRSV
jgi:UDP-glucose 4-epimerase